MHPDLEDFLEDAFAQVRPTTPGIGHVVVEPDYNVQPDDSDRGKLTRELSECLHSETLPREIPSSGFEIHVPRSYPLLSKYVRCISLHREPIPGGWVEVVPPGNWI